MVLSADDGMSPRRKKSMSKGMCMCQGITLLLSSILFKSCGASWARWPVYYTAIRLTQVRRLVACQVLFNARVCRRSRA